VNLHVSAGHPISPRRLWKPLVTAMTGATLLAALGLSVGVWSPSQESSPARSAGESALAPATTFVPARAVVGSSATPDEIAAYTARERAVAPALAVVGSSATPGEIATVRQVRMPSLYIVATDEQAEMVRGLRQLPVALGQPVTGTEVNDFRVLVARGGNDQAISEQVALARDWQRGLGLEPARVYDLRTP
jgi:hypothetical protein